MLIFIIIITISLPWTPRQNPCLSKDIIASFIDYMRYMFASYYIYLKDLHNNGQDYTIWVYQNVKRTPNKVLTWMLWQLASIDHYDDNDYYKAG